MSQLQKGDVFYITVLGGTLAYQVDQIKVVEPSNVEDLKVVPGEDYVTLATCTPYAINTHRLLVRGTRIPYQSDMAKRYHCSSSSSTLPYYFRRGGNFNWSYHSDYHYSFEKKKEKAKEAGRANRSIRS